MARKILITGSNGLIGSAVCGYFAERDFQVHGLDNNQRAVFFGPAGDTRRNQERLQHSIPGFAHHEMDIRDRTGVSELIKGLRPDLVVHTAAQPSHDRAASMAFADFDINAVGTLNLLESCRQFCADAPFVHMSTNKVYGDGPNRLPLSEQPERWDYADEHQQHGIAEDFPIDQSLHSLFGASKLAADVLVQEYGRYFNMPTCCLRGGCLTGPNHSGVELHGFLSYLVKCNLEGRHYSIFGYKGKQVRDIIHSQDVASLIHEFYLKPRAGEVYNLGGGKENSCSILEAFALVERVSGRPQKTSYVDQNRLGDHICYYSDLRKVKKHYSSWRVARSLPEIVTELVQDWRQRLPAA